MSLMDPSCKVTIIIHKLFEFWTPLHADAATRQSELPIEFGIWPIKSALNWRNVRYTAN